MAHIPSPRRIRLARAAGAAALVALACAGCSSKHVTGPDRTGAASGLVLASGGGPAASADVYLSSTFEINGTLELIIAFTNAQGRYSFTNLAPGRYVVEATLPNGTVAADSIDVPHAGTAGDTLQLVTAGKFTGTAHLAGVTDHRGIVLTAGGIFALATTDSLGRYEMNGIPPGTWRVTGSRPGYVDASTVGTVPAPGDSVELPLITLLRPAP